MASMSSGSKPVSLESMMSRSFSSLNFSSGTAPWEYSLSSAFCISSYMKCVSSAYNCAESLGEY
jgi:hypothetical protein